MNRGTQREYISYAPTPMGYLCGKKGIPFGQSMGYDLTPSEGLPIWELGYPFRGQEASGTDPQTIEGRG